MKSARLVEKLLPSRAIQSLRSAGAYATEESSDAFVEKIEGSLTNVMGLPMELLK